MGRIFAVGGPSGAGKTAFLRELLARRGADVRQIPRVTTRTPRADEENTGDYLYLSRERFIDALMSNEFIHVEQWGDWYYGIQRHTVEAALKSPKDSIILGGVFGAAELSKAYPGFVTELFLYPGTKDDLLASSALESRTEANRELEGRLSAKKFTNEESSAGEFLKRRREFNELVIAYTRGRMISNVFDLRVISNPPPDVTSAVNSFEAIRQETMLAFVSMPFDAAHEGFYQISIKEACKRVDLKPKQLTYERGSFEIVKRIETLIDSSRLVIAEISEKNPNVMIEVGYALQRRKPVILVTHVRPKDAPFILRGRHLVCYENDDVGIRDLVSKLQEAIKNTLLSPWGPSVGEDG